MRLEVQGRQYRCDQPFIGDLRQLNPSFGFGWGTVIEHMSKVGQAPLVRQVEDDAFLDSLMAFMWMIRLRNGERDLTLADVRMTPIDEIDFLPDDNAAAATADDGPDRDPSSALTATDQGDAAHHDEVAEDAPRPRSTKTSTRKSAAASR